MPSDLAKGKYKPKFVVFQVPVFSGSVAHWLNGSVVHWFSGSVVKNPPASAGDWGLGLIPGSGRSPGQEKGNSLQYSCLGNPSDRGAWQVTVHGVTKESDMI